MKWKPLIKEQLDRERAERIIGFIIAELERREATKSLGLLSGKSGVAIFWHYLFLNKGIHTYETNCLNTIDVVLNSISENPTPHSFCSGLSGVLWSLYHLKNIGAIQFQTEDIAGSEIDSFVVQGSLNDLLRNNYDYFHGGIGVILYLMERKDINFSKPVIEGIVSALENNAIKNSEGISWLDHRDPEGRRYNLGLAHGIPSIIILLCKIFQSGIKKEKAEELLTKSVNWLKDKKLSAGAISLYPTGYPPIENYSNSRLAWCYGDLGICISLIQAGLIMKNDEWFNEGLLIGMHASKRRDLKSNSVMDVCFCHGSAGIAHVFNRLYHYSEERCFRDAALYWFSKTFEFFEINGHLSMWKTETETNKPRWNEEISLLEGYAGVGLALLAGIGGIEPKWDKSLLLS